MVFWGVEVKPGKPYTHSVCEDELLEGSTLRLSQATLGLEGKSKERAVVKCKVGEGPELLLCSLIPGVSESCSLDLLFDQDVTFSVVGSTSVHLIGYYMPLEDDENEDDDYDFEGTSEEDSDDDDSDEDDSEMEEDDDERVPSGVKIEEINEDEAPSPAPVKLVKGSEEEPKPESKSSQKKRKKAETQAARVKAQEETKNVEPPAKAAAASADDSEDEDGFTKEATPIKKQAVEGSDGTATPAATAPAQSGEAAAPSPAGPESGKKKKRRNKNKNKEQMTPGADVASADATTPTNTSATPAATTPASEPAVKEGKKEKKEKAKENGVGKSTPTTATNGATPTTEKKEVKKGNSVIKKFPNGLEIHEVAMGKPDAKQAKPGEKVGMIYTGRLKSNGKVFDSNVGKKPFEFRLGVGEVIKGWDLGVNGMRVGDKRKLVIPATMGYGSKGVAGTIPGNATLEFDVELVNVKGK